MSVVISNGHTVKAIFSWIFIFLLLGILAVLQWSLCWSERLQHNYSGRLVSIIFMNFWLMCTQQLDLWAVGVIENRWRTTMCVLPPRVSVEPPNSTTWQHVKASSISLSGHGKLWNCPVEASDTDTTSMRQGTLLLHRILTLSMFSFHIPCSETALTGPLSPVSTSNTSAEDQSLGPGRPGPAEVDIRDKSKKKPPSAAKTPRQLTSCTLPGSCWR